MNSTSLQYRPWPEDPRMLVGSDGTVIGVSGKVRRPYINAQGYPVIGVVRRDNGRRRNVPVHQMVATSWLGPRPPGHQVAHNNGVPTDNRVTNLRWATAASNAADKVRHGTNNDGERHGLARLTDDAVRTIRASYAAGRTQAALARQYGVGQGTVQEAIHGVTWDHIPVGEVPLGTARRCRGTDQHRAKATPDLVREIRAAARAGVGATALAQRTGLGESAVRHIIAGRCWRHVQ